MKQVLQNLKTGATEVADIPCPALQEGYVLVHSSHSLLSTGTERMLVEFGKAGWIDKARRQPDKVRMVLDKVRTDGLLPTLEAVANKLDQPLPLGYCNVGVVAESRARPGSGPAFAAGERVASNGRHAEMVSVPANLCARVPDAVSDEEAAFTVLGAIGLQGIRLLQPTLGEAVVVTGLGLIGLLTVQLLRAHGCRVLGIDFDPEKLALAKRFGAEVVNLAAGEDPLLAAQGFSRGRGADAVIITATTASSQPVHQAAQMCRKRGRIVLVGVVGLELSRADFYEKELSFQVSCSYGPGRYDPQYEEKGADYPVGFVRWTEQRNFEAVLDMMADGRLDVKPLISHRFEIAEAARAYELVGGGGASLGILLRYPRRAGADARSVALTRASPTLPGQAVLSCIGAGSYATSVLLPAFRKAGARLRLVASQSGVSGRHAARKFGFEETTTDTDRLLVDAETTALVIATRHDSHAGLVLAALRSGKHVFVEKPLCLSLVELEEIERCYWELTARFPAQKLMVGFNRRFAPQVVKIKELLAGVRGPKSMVMTVNAGAPAPDHWTRGEAGGGRIIGEACHFIDLLRHLAGAEVVEHAARQMESAGGDTLTVTLNFADGSLGALHYFANGCKSFPKERLEIFAAGRVLQLDNFRKLTGFGWPGFGSLRLWRQDKGQGACAAAFLRSLHLGGAAPIPFAELAEVSRLAISIAGELR